MPRADEILRRAKADQAEKPPAYKKTWIKVDPHDLWRLTDIINAQVLRSLSRTDAQFVKSSLSPLVKLAKQKKNLVRVETQMLANIIRAVQKSVVNAEDSKVGDAASNFIQVAKQMLDMDASSKVRGRQSMAPNVNPRKTAQHKSHVRAFTGTPLPHGPVRQWKPR